MIYTIKRRLHSLAHDERFKEILHGSIYSILAKISAMLLGIITSIMGARYYGAEMIGFVAIIGSILGVTGLFSVFGLSTSLLKFVPEIIAKDSLDASKMMYRKILFLVFISSVLVSSVLFFFADFIANNIFQNSELSFFISLGALILIFRSINAINMSMIRSLKKIKFYAFLEFIPKVISLFLLLVMTFLFYNKYNLIYISFIVPVLVALVTFIYLFLFSVVDMKNSKSDNLPTYKTILSVSFPMFVTGGMFFLISQTDIIMMGMFRSTEEVGIYSIILSLALLTTFVLNSINIMVGPKFSELYHSGKMEELKYVAQKSSKLTIYATLPIFLVLIIFGKFILSFYGDEFVVGYAALAILIIGQLVNAGMGSVGYFLDMTGHHKKFRNIILLAGIINVVLNYFLIPEYGILGAAIASMISIVFWNVTAAIYIKKIYGFYITYIPYFTKHYNNKDKYEFKINDRVT